MSSVNRKYCNYTIVEMMMVIAIIGILMNAALYFYYHGQQTTMRQINQAFQLQSVGILTPRWREFVAANGDAVEITAGKILFRNGSRAIINGNQLSLISPTGSKTFALPGKAVIRFQQETPAGEAPLLVLYLYETGSRKAVAEDKFIRIVASTGRLERSKP